MPKKDKNTSASKKDVEEKLADQLSESVNMTSRDIVSGVNRFIERSKESLGGREVKPPYRRPIWYKKFFSLMHQRRVTRVTLEFIKLNIISARSEAYKLKNGLLFLNLIDRKGNAKPQLEKLRVTGQQFTKNFADIIRKAYSDLFDTIIVESAEPESIVNYMISRYGYSPPLAEEATALFVFFCTEAEITISKKLSTYQPRKRAGLKRPKTKRPRKQTTRREPERELEFDESFATLKFDEFVFAVKKDIASIEFARKQVNDMLDYLLRKLSQ